ncbi:MAG: putative ABC transporter permease [Oscillospiraceae bacterium]
MFTYTFSQWLMFFYVYCFIGWLIESVIVTIYDKKLTNRGFLRGPYLPLYGFGAITILFSTLPFREKPLLVFVFGMISTTILEYVTSWLMETTLKMRYWDYSDQKMNYKGRISLISSIFWGLLSLLLMYFLHSTIENFVFWLSADHHFVFILMVVIISILMISDTLYAFRTAFDVNKLLAKITAIKAELEKLKTQLSDKIDNSEAATQVRERYLELKSELMNIFEKMGFFKEQLIKANPHARSKNFNEALKEVRVKLSEKKAAEKAKAKDKNK